jgi:hypothetical protein
VVQIRIIENKMIPLDTLGHPLPPPVRPEHICRIPKQDWGRWWVSFHNNTLEKELDCNLCGLSFPESALNPLERGSVDPSIQRVFNTLGTVRVCRGCKVSCACGRTIIYTQKQQRGVCQVCCGGVKAVKKIVTKKIIKKKAPSGR